jgi:hypothetical protein
MASLAAANPEQSPRTMSTIESEPVLVVFAARYSTSRRFRVPLFYSHLRLRPV